MAFQNGPFNALWDSNRYPIITLHSFGGDFSTSTTGSDVGLLWLPMPAMKQHDKFIFDVTCSITNNANSKMIKFFACPNNATLVGGLNWGSSTATTATSFRIAFGLRYLGGNDCKFSNLTISSGTTDLSSNSIWLSPWYLGLVANITTLGTLSIRDVLVTLQKGNI